MILKLAIVSWLVIGILVMAMYRLAHGKEVTNYRCVPAETVIGDGDGMSKLTERQVLEIGSRTGVTHRKLADEFGVGNGLVRMVVNRKIWRHV